MQLSIRSKQVDVGDTLRDDIEERLTAAVGKHFERAIEGQVQLSREGSDIRCDITVHAGSGIWLNSHGIADDKRLAFDVAAERVEKRLRRFKRRLVGHHGRRSDSEPEPEEQIARDVVLAAEHEDTEAPIDGAPVTIAETTTPIRTISVSEAIMRLELAETQVLMFRNRAHGRLNVVYRRKDGNIGWIDPHDAERAV